MSAIRLESVSKRYPMYARPLDRLLELITGRPRHTTHEALHPVDLIVEPGEVLGVIGRNGAGKSTLLKLIAGTLQPSTGMVSVNGQISALLELGTGFHPDLTGKENVYLSAAVRGLSNADIDARYDAIIAFADIGDVLDQPVKTYSSGMLVRLAFSVATCTEPDVLIVDEALSVGDSAFAQKSFERIMGFRRSGKTILFCSHSMYQVEAICNRVVWVEQGQVRAIGTPAEVVTAYNGFLDELRTPKVMAVDSGPTPSEADVGGAAGFTAVEATARGHRGASVEVISGAVDLGVRVAFRSDPDTPSPSVALTLTSSDGRIVASLSNWNDNVSIERDADGRGEAWVVFPRLPLLKGTYWVNAFLLGPEGVRLLDSARGACELRVRQTTLEQGIVTLPHYWSTHPPGVTTEDAVDTTSSAHG